MGVPQYLQHIMSKASQNLKTFHIETKTSNLDKFIHIVNQKSLELTTLNTLEIIPVVGYRLSPIPADVPVPGIAKPIAKLIVADVFRHLLQAYKTDCRFPV